MRICSGRTRKGTTHDCLKRVEQQHERLAHPPRNQDQQRNDKQCDLDATSDRNTHGQIKLSFPRNNDRGCVLRRIADDRDDDEGDPLLRDVGVVAYKTFERIHEGLGGEERKDADTHEQAEGNGEVELESLALDGS